MGSAFITRRGAFSSGGGWDDIDTGLEFRSVSSFTINVEYPNWDGTMEYCNSENGWQEWDGSVITSGETATGHYIYIRGTGNTIITEGYEWTLTGSYIECNGNIEKLLDYVTVENGLHPTMADSCYSGMFYNCTSLITVPALPATTLTYDCYGGMFGNCTNLITIPALPATTLADECYFEMFYGCTKIKLSTSQTGTYTKAYRIPTSGTGTTASEAMGIMFDNTGGTFTGTPTINTIYYLDNSNSIVS